MYDAVIIGGGAAGLLCAGFAAQRGRRVIVLERGDRPARKILVTGKGRCNVTNNCEAEEFLRNIRSNARFLYSAVNAFSPHDAMALFESLGVALKTERGNRVFPVSDQAEDIARAMRQFAEESGAKIICGSRVAAIETREGAVSGVRTEDGTVYPAGAAVIATGGKSYPDTGSTGDGYRLARELGHTVIPPHPSLVAVRTRETWCAELMGLSLRNVTLTLKNKAGKTVYSELGELLFTHFGVSGPLVLTASSYMGTGAENFRMEIDLKPALDEQTLDARILRDFASGKNRDFANALDQLLPRLLIPVAVRLSGIPPETKVNTVTREQRRALVQLLKALPLTPSGFLPIETAVITAGGVSVKEMDPKTMESKRIKGLYFAGEVIDVDALTGGFNLQIAYSTGCLAGNHL